MNTKKHHKHDTCAQAGKQKFWKAERTFAAESPPGPPYGRFPQRVCDEDEEALQRVEDAEQILEHEARPVHGQESENPRDSCKQNKAPRDSNSRRTSTQILMTPTTAEEPGGV